MTAESQAALAAAAGTSHQMLAQIARGNKQIELGFADVIVALSNGNVALSDLPLTERALAQNAIRSNAVSEDAS